MSYSYSRVPLSALTPSSSLSLSLSSVSLPCSLYSSPLFSMWFLINVLEKIQCADKVCCFAFASVNCFSACKTQALFCSCEHTHTLPLPFALSAHSHSFTLTHSHTPPLCLYFCWAELVLQHKDWGWMQHCLSSAFSCARWNELLSLDGWSQYHNKINSMK